MNYLAMIKKRFMGEEHFEVEVRNFFGKTFDEAYESMENHLVRLLEQYEELWVVRGTMELDNGEMSGVIELDRTYIYPDIETEHIAILENAIAYYERINDYGEFDDELAELEEELFHQRENV